MQLPSSGSVRQPPAEKRHCFSAIASRGTVLSMRAEWPTRRRQRLVHRKCFTATSRVPLFDRPRNSLLIVGMTTLPARLPKIRETVLSLGSQSRRPDRLILSLPRRSRRQGIDYLVPDEVRSLLVEHPWVELNWVDHDDGPGTKLTGVLRWVAQQVGKGAVGGDDVLMVLDDDHAYLPWALGELASQLLRLPSGCMCTFFAYFFRGLMVPQGADIMAFRMAEMVDGHVVEFHDEFVRDNADCFFVDDLWIAVYLRMRGLAVHSLRDVVTSSGSEAIYERTANSSIAALMDLDGDQRRDRVMMRACDSLLVQLLEAAPSLLRLGGQAAQARLTELHAEVAQAERQLERLSSWLDSTAMPTTGPIAQGALEELDKRRLQAQAHLKRLRHLYRMQ